MNLPKDLVSGTRKCKHQRSSVISAPTGAKQRSPTTNLLFLIADFSQLPEAMETKAARTNFKSMDLDNGSKY